MPTPATLPKNLGYDALAAYERITAATGIQFHGDADDLFVHVTLPDGWKIVPTDHSMWSDLVDPKGVKRASIFSKEAFYDRSAHMDLLTRYVRNVDYAGIVRTYSVIDRETGQTLRTFGTTGSRDWDTQDRLAAEMQAWLAEHYPDHKDPLAYWS